MKHLKIGYLQQHNVADVKTNMQRLADGVRDLAKRGAELVVLQELHNSLYFCQVEDVDNFDLAEPIPGPSTDFYGALARECNVVIVTSLFERRAPGLYHNTAVVMERDGSLAGKYRKMHIPDDPAYYEKFYFTPGVDYFVKETKAPVGYNINSTIFKVTAVAKAYTPVGTVENGATVVKDYPVTVPQTGGMGTMMFYVGGAALIACAGVLLFVLKRKKAAK